MAVYHLSAKLISRKSGRSATAAAAYRAGERIVDQRTGEVHDYTRKRGIEHAEIVMPASTDWQPGRDELWNAVELKNRRADAQVAREFEVALPAELPEEARRRLALDFAREIADRYSVAVDVAIHAPSGKGDDRNHHAHILTTTNRVEGNTLGNKARELDLVAHNMSGKVGQSNEIDHLRERFAALQNERLAEHGVSEHVDHRSLKDQGITHRLPQIHLGPAATQMHRRGVKSDKWLSREQANEALQAAAEAGRLAGEAKTVERSILVADAELASAIREREQTFADALYGPVKLWADPHTITALDAGWVWPGVEVATGDAIMMSRDGFTQAGEDIRNLPYSALPVLVDVNVDEDDGGLNTKQLGLLKAAGDQFVDDDGTLTMSAIRMVLVRDDRVLRSRQDISLEQIEACGAVYMTSGDSVRKREQEAARGRGEPEQESSKEMEYEAEQAKPTPTPAQRQPNRGPDFER